MLSRRDVVGRLAAGTAAVCVAGVARANVRSARPDVAPSTSAPDAHAGNGPAPTSINESGPRVTDAGTPATITAPAPWELLRPLTVGSALGAGWQLAGLTGAVDGSCVITLQNEQGRTHRVHVCSNGGQPQGLVYTKRFDLLVMNGGQGDLPTDESFAQAVAALAHTLAANEGDQAHGTVIAALMSHAERVERFAGAAKLR